MQTRHLGATQRSFLYKVEIFRQRLKVLFLVPGCCEHTTRHLGATQWKSFSQVNGFKVIIAESMVTFEKYQVTQV